MLPALVKLCQIVFVVAMMQAVQIRVAVVGDRVILYANDVQTDIGALVGCAFDIGQRLKKQETRVNSTGAGAQPFQMFGAQRVNQLVDDFLQRLDTKRQTHVALGKRGDRDAQDLFGRFADNDQLLFRFLGERQLFVEKLLGKPLDIDRVVADTLKIADCLQQKVRFAFSSSVSTCPVILTR